MKINKLTNFLGNTFITSAYLFIIIFSLVVVGDQNEPITRDLFGLEVPHAPPWTSYVPYAGWVLGVIFEFFSIHGIVGLIIFSTLLYIGLELKNKWRKMTEKNGGNWGM